ncbi:MAG: phosphatidate cytidylyltransferase [Isosphaeraceae bacterium]
MLMARVVSGMILIAVALGVLLVDESFGPWYPFWFLLCMSALTAAGIELVGLLSRTIARPSMNTVMGGVLALTLSNWMPHVSEYLAGGEQSDLAVAQTGSPVAWLAWPFLSFVGVLMVTFIVQSVQFVRPGRTMATIAGTILAVAYLGLLGSFVIQLRWLDGPHQGVTALIFLVATAKGADTGAYTVGRIAGRHKLWPSLSPNKTVEGAVGGLVFAVSASLLVLGLARHLAGIEPITIPAALGYGLLVGVAAQLGDLMESMIKRDCERKDASSAVPGFGGVLDVLDSLLFAGPVAFGYWLCVTA